MKIEICKLKPIDLFVVFFRKSKKNKTKQNKVPSAVWHPASPRSQLYALATQPRSVRLPKQD